MASLGSNLLGTLPQRDLESLKPYLKITEVKRGAVLLKEGADVDSTYFPCGASIAAFEVLLKEGKVIETNMVGREGVIGGVLSKGHLPACARVRVLFPGVFLKINNAEIEKAKAEMPAVGVLFDRYSNCLMAQLLQSAACNAAHPIEQRWLRFGLDRIGTEEVPLTQDQLANILGVSRTYVSRVISRLKAALFSKRAGAPSASETRIGSSGFAAAAMTLFINILKQCLAACTPVFRPDVISGLRSFPYTRIHTRMKCRLKRRAVNKSFVILSTTVKGLAMMFDGRKTCSEVCISLQTIQKNRLSLYLNHGRDIA
jgi:CRP-like cAMP-binding protein